MTVDLQKKQAELLEEDRKKRRAAAEKQWLRDRERGDVTRNPAIRFVIENYLPPFIEGIDEWTASCRGRSHAGRQMNLGIQMSRFDSGILAFLAAKTIINQVAVEGTKGLVTSSKDNLHITPIAVDIGRAIEDEHMLNHFYTQDPNAYKWVGREIKKRQILGYRHKRVFYRQVYRHKIENGDIVPHVPFTSTEQARMGVRLIELFCDTTHMCALKRVSPNRRGQAKTILKPSDVIDTWIQQKRISAILTPDNIPMITKPHRWKVGRPSGGYLEEGEQYMIKASDLHSDGGARVNSHMTEEQAATSIECLSILQETPFKVNERVLAVLKEVWKRGLSFGKLPANLDIPIPKRPQGALSAKESPTGKSNELHSAWKKQARNAHEADSHQKSKRLSVNILISVATEYAKYPRIYFPHQMDFRGRFYSMSTILQPQGTDHCRGLLMFARGKKVTTPEAMGWLQVHGANCYGFDKGSMVERINWVKENFKEISHTARYPTSDRALDFWTKADKPFMFLAWCFDYFRVLKGHKSHIAVAMDGSCNGLQHFSAMLRDPNGAAAVNLEPGDKPSDIYQEVADLANQKLKALAEQGGEKGQWAKEFLRMNIDRKVCKRSVMVMPYGGTLHAVCTYLHEELYDKLVEAFGVLNNKQTFMLGSVVLEATHETVVAASRAMEWLRKVAKIVAKHADGEHMRWETPSGFVVSSDYRLIESKVVQTRLNGEAKDRRHMTTVSLGSYKDTIDIPRSVNGIAPNFVHSLDAAALSKTVVGVGVGSVMMIHDDYGTHAADAPKLAKVLRKVFVEMYADTNLLEDLKQQVEEQTGLELPEPPAQLSFDVRKVLKSKYFFA